jgi:hypothetical protein
MMELQGETRAVKTDRAAGGDVEGVVRSALTEQPVRHPCMSCQGSSGLGGRPVVAGVQNLSPIPPQGRAVLSHTPAEGLESHLMA